MLHIKIYTTSRIIEEEVTLRKINEILTFLLDPKLKEIKIGKNNQPFRKSEILNLDLFIRDDNKKVETLLDTLWQS